MRPTDVFNLVASGFSIGVPLGAGLMGGYRFLQNRRLMQQRKAMLLATASAGELFIAVGIGGQGQPEDDVAAYIKANHPGIQSFLVYQAPPTGTLGQPDTAMRVAEDLRGWVEEFGKGQIVKIHFFPAGIVAYPFLMGALLRNMTTVIVYQKAGASYVPLYEWDGAFANSHKRTTRALTKMQIVPVSGPVVSSTPSPPALAAPAASPAVAPPSSGSPPPGKP